MLTFQGREMTAMARVKKQYYKSWASYDIPMHPTGPIEYVATESLKSFYLAEYDSVGNLIRFTKFLREEKGKTHIPLSSPRLAGASICFCAIPEDKGRYKPGAVIEYRATEGADAYFQGIVTRSGDGADSVLVRTSIFFDDEYSYWANGKLKTRLMHKRDGNVIRSSYNEAGIEIGKQ